MLFAFTPAAKIESFFEEASKPDAKVRRLCERLCQCRRLADLNLGFSGDIGLFSHNIRSGLRDGRLNS
jgi:hypothetical protein